ncbi:MAG: hypothetical protein HQL27_00805 [Candidatus Omnitrophica bacterium]|nr:hypothetical protein [Candidatus Omnitrophota bacterium]
MVFPGKRGCGNKRASMLIEALLSTVILSVSLTVIISSITACVRSIVYSSDYTEALFLAEDKMLKLLEKGSVAVNLKEEEAFPAPDDRFKYILQTNISEFSKAASDLPSEEKINEVALKVYWDSGKRKNALEFNTYLFNLPDEK